MRIVILVSALIVIGLVFFALQVPTIHNDKINSEIRDAISSKQVTAEDEVIVREAVKLAVETLESKQLKRLKYLVSAYVVIWLVFMLYLVRLGKQQGNLDQRLSQLEQDTPNSDESP